MAKGGHDPTPAVLPWAATQGRAPLSGRRIYISFTEIGTGNGGLKPTIVAFGVDMRIAISIACKPSASASALMARSVSGLLQSNTCERVVPLSIGGVRDVANDPPLAVCTAPKHVEPRFLVS